MKTALVIGGTGPTGPYIVNGLIDRGYDVVILHSGAHEVDFKQEIEHIHADVHFRETFKAALGNRSWDIVVASYGRLKLTADVLRGHTGRVVAIGGATASLASADDERWGAIGRPLNLDEARGISENDPLRNKLGYQMAQAQEALFAAHREGHFNATQIAFPILYGPRQPGANDWSIVRRALDKRRHLIIADGGIKAEARCFTANAAHAVLLAVEQPEASSGKRYLVADEMLYSMRQRIEAIARIIGHEFELVDMPWDFAVPCHPLWNHVRESRFRDTSGIRSELGYANVVDTYAGLEQSVAWLIESEGKIRTEIENQLGDPFDYAREDALIRQWHAVGEQFSDIDYPLARPAHIYRHPSKPNEAWKRPDSTT